MQLSIDKNLYKIFDLQNGSVFPWLHGLALMALQS